MEQNNNHIIYNAEAIHRYFSGKMNAAEMHAMEKASLNDALLAEAMEGYEQSETINTNVGYATIQAELDALKDKISGKTISIKRPTNNWWKAAAAVLLLVSGAYAFYRISKDSNKNEVADTQKKASINVKVDTIADMSAAILKDSLLKERALLEKSLDSLYVVQKEEKQSMKENGKIVPIQINPAIKDSIDLKNNFALNDKKEINTIKTEKYPFADTKQTEPKQLAYVNRLPASNNAPGLSRKYIPSNAEENIEKQSAYKNQNFLKKTAKPDYVVFLGKVTDAENNPIPYAGLIINNQQQSKTDVNGLFNLSASDSSMRLDIAATNYYPQTVTINANRTATIKLILKKSIFRKNIADSTSHLSTVQLLYNSGAEPKEGWENYRLYLVNQLTNSVYDDGRKVVGETIVQFEINRINQPNNFTFEKSIDEDVNNAIESLILNQTEWHFLPAAGVPATVRLRIVF